jgi:predicted PurR-regulated permease PerM
MTPIQDLTRTTLAVLFIFALLAASFWVVRPFLPATVWATMIVVATWPVMLRAQAHLWGRRSLAVAVMILGLLLVVFVPIVLAANTIQDNADIIARWSRQLSEMGLPQPPAWIEGLPIVGTRAAARWREIAAAGPEELATHLTPYAERIGRWLVGEAGTLAMIVVHFLLTFVIAAILYTNGEKAAESVLALARRLDGARGEGAARLAAQAIRGVALGIIVTAIVQSVLAGIGMVTAGVPSAGALAAIAFVFCVAQLGPTLVLVPVVIWLYWKGDTGWATGLLVWTILVASLDNVLRPYLIRRGADLPLLLIFAGVLGGLLAFGIIGLFIGPVVLAVAYTLGGAWVREAPSSQPPVGSQDRS